MLDISIQIIAFCDNGTITSLCFNPWFAGYFNSNGLVAATYRGINYGFNPWFAGYFNSNLGEPVGELLF